MRRKRYCLIGLVLILLGAVAIGQAQPPLGAQTTQNVGLDFTTADTLVLENTGATVNMGQATAADYDNGYINNAATPDHTLNVAANTTWQLAVRRDTAEIAEAWTKRGVDCPAAAKPGGSIKYSKDNFATAGVALTAFDVVVETGSATASQDILIDYRVDVGSGVDTGICTYEYDSVVFTLAATEAVFPAPARNAGADPLGISRETTVTIVITVPEPVSTGPLQ